MRSAKHSKFVLRFDEIGVDDRPSVGGKGANLADMARAGMPVPSGFAVTTHAFELFLHSMAPSGSVRERIDRQSADDLATANRVCSEVRAMFQAAALPDELREAISFAYQQYEPKNGPLEQPVAIRSSATSEDSSEASFAGLQDTFLWVRGVESVLDHLCKCWASLYNLESVTYRRRLALAERGVAMGVVIQRMIDARSSGVMFTRSPATGDRSVVAIESSWGLGTAIVSGEVTPDKFVVGKITGGILDRVVSPKVLAHAPNLTGTKVVTEEVSLARQNAPSLTDAEIAELVELAKKVERHFGCPQDIEWAIARDSSPDAGIFLLQSRPETVWANKEKAPVAQPKEKSFDHIFSHLGGGVSPK